MTFISIKQLPSKTGETVKLRGWLHHVRRQGKLTFLVLRDPTGFLQAVIKPSSADQPKSVANKLTRETAVYLTGIAQKDPRAPYGGIELQVINIEKVISYASPDLEHEIRPDSGPQVFLDKRHLVLRGEKAADIMRIRDFTMRYLREFFFNRMFVEVTPSTIVQTQVEGGSTLFSFNYFDQEAYLTQ